MMYIRFESDPSFRNQNLLLEGILDQAKAHGMPAHKRFAFFLYDDDHQVCGGIKGSNFYGALYIDYIYIIPVLQGQGYGKALLAGAEDWGQQQGCTFSTLTTMSWEAKDFYIKQGYTIEFEQKGYTHQTSMFYLRKELHMAKI